jgi:predicted DNA-binding protein
MTPKDSSIGFRVSGEVKEALEQIAKKEGRSLAQVCDLILRGGIIEYEREGAAYLQRILHSDTAKKPKPRG